MNQGDFFYFQIGLFEKAQHLGLIPMGAETAQFYYVGLEGILLVHKFEQGWRAFSAGFFILGPLIKNTPAQGVLGHVSDHKDGVTLAVDLVAQVMEDTAGFTHSRGGYDDVRFFFPVEGHGLLHRGHKMHLVE